MTYHMAPPADLEELESWPVGICPVTRWWAILQEDICRYRYRLTSFSLPFTYNTPCCCISGFFSPNIPSSRSLDWLKAFPQSHLMSKTSYNITMTMSYFRVPFSLSRQWYQIFPPLHMHFSPYSNCMCHAGKCVFQHLNDILWNLNRVIIHDNKH